jgi:hypothetical protein
MNGFHVELHLMGKRVGTRDLDSFAFGNQEVGGVIFLCRYSFGHLFDSDSAHWCQEWRCDGGHA